MGKRYANEIYNLTITHPELSKEWDHDKNNGELPEHFIEGSGKSKWWICPKGHSFEAEIRFRTKKKQQCPYCTRKKVCADNSLAVTHPHLLNEWNFDKNTKKPEEYLSGTPQRVWWKCHLGHEWETRLATRTKSTPTGCPKCKENYHSSLIEYAIYHLLNKIIECDNRKTFDIKLTRNKIEVDIYIPELKLAIEYDGWYHSKEKQVRLDKKKSELLIENGIDVARIRFHKLPILDTNDKVHIIKDDNGTVNGIEKILRDILKLINELYSKNLDIDEIINKIDINENIQEIKQFSFHDNLENSLEKMNPKLLEIWDYDKNKVLPKHVTYASSMKVWWKCTQGHSYEQIISDVNRGNRCPYCSHHKLTKEKSLENINPELIKEWDYERNEKKPENYHAMSNKSVWWICRNNTDHKWESKISNRNNGKGCPYCSKLKVVFEESFPFKHPELFKEWNHNRNVDVNPYELACKSNKRVWWICEHKHEWESVLNSRINIKANTIRKCPYCSKERPSEEYNLKVSYPQIAEEWDLNKNGDLKPEKVTKGSGKKVWWVCKNSHTWQARIVDRTGKGYMCPQCKQR